MELGRAEQPKLQVSQNSHSYMHEAGYRVSSLAHESRHGPSHGAAIMIKPPRQDVRVTATERGTGRLAGVSVSEPEEGRRRRAATADHREAATAGMPLILAVDYKYDVASHLATAEFYSVSQRQRMARSGVYYRLSREPRSLPVLSHAREACNDSW